MVALLGGCGMMSGGRSPTAASETSDTIARIRGEPREVAVLRVEDGDVWPEQEGPRATLANPDAAMRNIPQYRPGELDRMSGPVGRSTWQPTDPPEPRPMPPGLGSSSPPPPPQRQIEPPRSGVIPAPTPPRSAPPRVEGRVLQTPNGPVTVTGGTERVQSFTVPGGGTGTIHRNDDNTSTIIGPDGRVQVIPTPR
jgi:hypothetical protein